jgi:hypothetical protein
MKAKILQVCLVILVLAFVGCASGGAASGGSGDGIVLKAKDAEIVSEQPLPSLTIEEPNGNLGYWNFIDEYPQWEVEIPAAGDYMVTLRYAAWSEYAGSSFVLEVGGEVKLESVLEQTSGAEDGWFAFKNIDFGVIALDAGAQTLAMKITELKGGQAACNLIKITLTLQ